MTPRRSVLLATAFSLLASVAGAQLSVTIKDIGPDRSNNSDPDGASAVASTGSASPEACRRESTRRANSAACSAATTAASTGSISTATCRR
jgi:hypothetical protein